MRCATPQISWHNRERIASVDFQNISYPNNKLRLASGGDDKHVVIWEVAENLGLFEFRCLADLCRHQNSVNIVRWSHDGQFLASGDSDSVIFIWHCSDRDASATVHDLFGQSYEENKCSAIEERDVYENWSVLKILRGHLQDVVGLSWSPCGRYLISCSTDTTAIVYDVNKGYKLKIISDHKGWVNGIEWDPKSKFVASICSDRWLRIYNTKTFRCAYKVHKCQIKMMINEDEEKVSSVRLFHDDTFQSFYRRLAFSPDGEILVVPSGVQEVDTTMVHCVYLFLRKNFLRPVLYLPCKEFCIAARFSAIKYKLRNDVAKCLFALPYRMIYAIATQNSVLIYDTQQQEPFARVSKIHYIALNDLTWSPDGNKLVVSSTDGFCSIISFVPDELGIPYQDHLNDTS